VQQKPDVKVLAVGMDGRTHSFAFKEKVIRGLTDSDLDVIFYWHMFITCTLSY